MNPNEIRALPCGAYQTNAYLVCPDGRGDAFLIDPGDDLSALNAAIAESGRTLSAILLTHGHFDHMLAAAPLQKETGAEVYVSEKDVIHHVKALSLTVVPSPCPANGRTKREDMKALLDHICRSVPNAREQLLTALRSDDQYALWDKPKPDA